MDLKKKVTTLHNRIKELGYENFKRTHVQEVLATANGFRNFHTMKAHYEGSPLQEALDVLLKREKNFLLPVGCSTIDQYYSDYEFVNVTLSEKDINKILSFESNPIFDDSSIISVSLKLESLNIEIVDSVDRDNEDEPEEITGFYYTDLKEFNENATIGCFISKNEINLVIELPNKKEVITLSGNISLKEINDIKWSIIT